MSLDSLNAEFHALLAKAEGLGHTGLDELKSVWAKVTGQAGVDAVALEHEASMDTAQVAHDAEAAAKPVVAEAKADAETVAEQAVADAKQLADGSVPPASA